MHGEEVVWEVKETQSAHPKAISAILEISDFYLILFGFRITGAKAELSLWCRVTLSVWSCIPVLGHKFGWTSSREDLWCRRDHRRDCHRWFQASRWLLPKTSLRGSWWFPHGGWMGAWWRPLLDVYERVWRRPWMIYKCRFIVQPSNTILNLKSSLVSRFKSRFCGSGIPFETWRKLQKLSSVKLNCQALVIVIVIQPKDCHLSQFNPKYLHGSSPKDDLGHNAPDP